MGGQEEKIHPIGVIDSGVGGLTVVQELQRVLPNEALLYFGDNANCPYGNRSEAEILELTHAMLRRMQQAEVKLVVVACNTISALISQYAGMYPFPIVGIIEPAVRQLIQSGARRAGLFATAFTVASNCYQDMVHALNPQVELVAVPSLKLAALVDSGKYEGPEVEAEVEDLLAQMRKSCGEEGLPQKIILGCTHYPIVEQVFREKAPLGTEFINPAVAQAETVRRLLVSRGVMEPAQSKGQSKCGKLWIETSGDASVYAPMIQHLALRAESIGQKYIE